MAGQKTNKGDGAADAFAALWIIGIVLTSVVVWLSGL